MPSLKDLLADVAEVPLGPDKSRKDRLRDDLSAVRSRNERYFMVAVVLLAVFFVASWVLVFVTRDDPNVVKLLGASVFGGSSVFGCVLAMVRLWQRKVAIDIIIVLLNSLPPAEFSLAVQKLLLQV